MLSTQQIVLLMMMRMSPTKIILKRYAIGTNFSETLRTAERLSIF